MGNDRPTWVEMHVDPDGEWAALYVDGKLTCGPGDRYRIEEHAFEVLGVKVIDDPSFLRGQDDGSNVAATVQEVREYAAARREALAEAAQLVIQAADLRARAARIEEAWK